MVTTVEKPLYSKLLENLSISCAQYRMKQSSKSLDEDEREEYLVKRWAEFALREATGLEIENVAVKEKKRRTS